jgi:hypothetical protein
MTPLENTTLWLRLFLASGLSALAGVCDDLAWKLRCK